MNDDTFSVEALAADERFQAWVLHPTPDLRLFWETYQTDHPDRRVAVDEARRLVQHWAGVRPAAPTADEVADLRAAIFERIGATSSDTGRVLPFPSRRNWLPARWVAAASVVLLLGLGLAWWLQTPGEVRVQTTYGQTHTLTLPDGSTVTLNANSSLRYPDNLDAQAVRELHLTGEAFFSVRHTADHRPFRVRTTRLNVEVLGTEFNVSQRRNRERVVLESGKVRVVLAGNGGTTATLKPGDLVELQAGTAHLNQRRVAPGAFSAWRQHRWKLQREPLADVALRLEETFGVRVVFAHDADRRRLVSGEVPTHDLSALCDILGETLGLRFVRSGDEVRIGEAE